MHKPPLVPPSAAAVRVLGRAAADARVPSLANEVHAGGGASGVRSSLATCPSGPPASPPPPSTHATTILTMMASQQHMVWVKDAASWPLAPRHVGLEAVGPLAATTCHSSICKAAQSCLHVRHPLPAYWTLQVARFVSNLQAMGGERVARLAMLDSVALAADTDTGLPLARQPWAAQVSRVLAAAGAPCDLTADEGVAIPELAEALLERHVASYTHASVKVQRYIEDVWGGSISAEAYTHASFLCDVPERRRRVRLAHGVALDG